MSRKEHDMVVAAKGFLTVLRGYKGIWEDDELETVWKLILGAFTLYWKDWGPLYDIRCWVWPEETLCGQRTFVGDEPWTVLLRRAVELTGVSTKPA